MSRVSKCWGARLRRCFWILPGVIVSSLGVAPNAIGEELGANVIAIEEDWELVVKQPDAETQAPQVTCVVAPDNGSVFAAFNLNHKAFPQFEAGGLHLQIWNGDTPLGSAQFPNNSLLTTPSETITWTTRMNLDGGQLWFEVVSGSSQTWGSFGGTGALKASVGAEYSNLNQYDADDSAANSGVSYAGNRVTSLKLKAVRKLLKNGTIQEDSQARVVYPQN
jgi:hypothetical protein